MKTIEEFFNEIKANDELKKIFLELNQDEVVDFAARHGCKTTIEEIKTYLAEKESSEGELSDDDLANVTGGMKFLLILQ